MKVVAVIPARYQSSRFPGKPLADICGKPMVWWVYQEAKKVEYFDVVYVAADDNQMFKSVALEFYGDYKLIWLPSVLNTAREVA